MAVVRNSSEKVQEIQDAAERLELLPELIQWSKEDVQKWILWAIREFYSLCLDLLEVDGKELSNLNLSEFQKRVPNLATYFYNELQIWKKVLDNSASTDETCNNNNNKPAEVNIPAYVIQDSETPEHSPKPPSEQLTDNELKSPSVVHTPPEPKTTPNASLSRSDSRTSDVEITDVEVKKPPLISISKANSISNGIKREDNVVDASPMIDKSPSVAGFPYPYLAGFPQSPLSPHVLAAMQGKRPPLIIPPPAIPGMPGANFPMPFPLSPAVMPSSPFKSPMPSPDVRSPSISFLPNMEALRENILRLEQHRQFQQAKIMERQQSQELVVKTKRKRQRKSTSEKNLEKPATPQAEAMAKLDLKQENGTGVESAVEKPAKDSVQVGYNNKGEPVRCKIEDDSGQTSPLTSPPIVSSMSSICSNAFLRQYSLTLAQSADNNNISKYVETANTMNKNNLKLPNLNRSPDSSEPRIKAEKQSPVAVVRQNSHEIPYYQATSLSQHPSDSTQDLIPFDDAAKVHISTPDVSFGSLHNESETSINLSPARPESSSANGSYSPISSPSDTEVELPEAERPFHSPIIPHPNYHLFDRETEASAHEQNPGAIPHQIHQLNHLLPSVLPNSGPSNFNSVLQPGQKVHKKRGRPPGSKALARPLGPTDIQKGYFRPNHLWKFLLEILEQPQQFGASIQWLDRQNGMFKIINSAHVASMWGKRKNNGKMTYDKFSRSIRQYYKKGIIVKTKPSKLIYQFGTKYFNPNG